MNPIGKVFTSLFGAGHLDSETAQSRQIHREWDRQRSLATSPAEREEIDAIFSRNL